MAGLSGIWHRDGAPLLKNVLMTMVDAAIHRGQSSAHVQDMLGFVAQGSVGLSFTGNYLVVAHARLDNRDELIPLLKNHHLLGPNPSDTNIILAAYRHWGTDAPARLIGDFAFAIWDASKQQLFAARDPLAMRPLYYYISSERFAFASEVKQLLSLPGISKTIDETTVALYLSGRFDPLGRSFYKDIYQLEPAYALLITKRDVRRWRYWDIDAKRTLYYRRDEDYAEHFRDLFLRAVKDRLNPAQPVALFLSGGVDSGTLASSIGWLEQSGVSLNDIHAFSFAFDTFPECDEREISNAIAEHYGFQTHTVDMDQFYPLAHYPEHGPDLDEPYIGAYQAALEQGLSCAQSLEVGLMMGGDRGDLLLGDDLFDPLGMFLRGRLALGLRELNDARRWRFGRKRRVLWRDFINPLITIVAPGIRERYYRLRPAHPVLRTPDWLEPDLAKRTGLSRLLANAPVASNLRGARLGRYERIFLPLHMRGAAWSERTQAKYGLAFADVFSDRRLVEFVLAMPQWQVQRAAAPKALIRQGLARTLPSGVKDRLRKVSPEPLYEAALRDYARGTITGLLEGSRAGALGYVKADELNGAYKQILAGGRISAEFWWALTLEMWLRKYHS